MSAELVNARERENGMRARAELAVTRGSSATSPRKAENRANLSHLCLALDFHSEHCSGFGTVESV